MRKKTFQTGLYSVLLLAVAATAGALVWSQLVSTDTALEQQFNSGTVQAPEVVVEEDITEDTTIEPEFVIDPLEDAPAETNTNVEPIPTNTTVTPIGTPTDTSESNTPVVAPVDVVTITVADVGVTTTVPFTSGVTVHEAMQQANANGALHYETSSHSSLGVFVESINGIGEDSGKNWILRVNGKLASVGAAGYKLQSGDQIAWTYEDNY